MILFYIICGLALVGGLVAMGTYNKHRDDGLLIIGVVVVIVSFVLLVAIPLARYSAQVKAEAINRQYGTSYTAREMFWAGETITKTVEGYRIQIDHYENPAAPAK